MTDELQGQCVWVHPELIYDPDKKSDLIGTIVASDLAADIVLVSFEDSMPGLFSTDALFVFKTAEDINTLLDGTIFPDGNPDLEALIMINFLVRKDSPEDQSLAMELARVHKNIQPFCLETLKGQLARNQSLDWSR